MVICACDPSLGLRAAVQASGLPDPRGPAAVAPLEKGAPAIGGVNPPAERAGVRSGMDVGTALEICPRLELFPPDPAGMVGVWDLVICALEGIGAEVEVERPGKAFFDPTPILGIHGGLDGLVRESFRAVRGRAMLGIGPSRLAAMNALAPCPETLEPVSAEALGSHLDQLPIRRLQEHLGESPGADLFGTLDRLGISTLGGFRGLETAAVADRFGQFGLEALRIAQGVEPPLVPRSAQSGIEIHLDLESIGGGERLPVALDLACRMISSRLGEADLFARNLSVAVVLDSGGSLFREFVPRAPTRSARTFSLLTRDAFGPLHSPVLSLTLGAPRTTGDGPRQEDLFGDPSANRRKRLAEAAKQVGVAVGEGTLMRVVEADPDSRLPERRVVMVPLAGGGSPPGDVIER
ncbi:MAG: hypothetical protein ACO3CR_07770 [Solirubrobacterales bacterium]